jgi:predicted RNA-binding protein YlqC (UPF0109 family)
MSTKTIDQQFIEYVVQSLVSKPEAVIVERKIDEKGVLLTLTVDPEDLGRVIGKRGATAQSLRTLLRALGTKQEARFNLKIVDNGEPRPEREDRRDDRRDEDRTYGESSSAAQNVEENDSWSTSDTSAAEDAANDSGEEESAVARTRRELEDLDDLDV